MEHKGTQTLETKRLILRRFEEGDLDALYANWAGDERTTRFLTWPTYRTPEDGREVLDEWIASYADPSFYQWAIVLRELGEPIGSISVVGEFPEVCGVEIGYCIGPTWWGQGIVSEALSAVLDYFFETVGVLRVQAKHDVNNPASGGVMRHCGMRYEGTLRGADRNNQGIVDTCVYGMLASDR
ncbi:MAG: GNAT family N-acetyltransferase [Coriobacteriales bacterium]|nr:GNAT family N-acetyltransferase [Coriobacteriales bacterium]